MRALSSTAEGGGGNGGGRSVTTQTANVDAKKSNAQQQQSQIELNPPKGTRDFPPEEMRKRNWLFDSFRQTALLFGFEAVSYTHLTLPTSVMV